MDMPASQLKVLMVEDSPADAELVLRALREEIDSPIEHVRVASEAALRAALAGFDPDVVLSDFSMPGFSGQEALHIVHAEAPHLPFLFVSGTIGEELAIEALQRGAIDYVLKDNLRRLPSAVQRALRIAREREERQRMEQALRESEERFRTIIENSQDWIWEMDRDGLLSYSNQAIERLLGYRATELLGKDALQLMHPEDRASTQTQLPELMARKTGWRGWRLRWCHRDGSVRVMESTATPLLDANGELLGYRGIDHDLTELLQQQARIQHLARIHGVLSALGNAVLRADSRQGVLDAACRVAVEQGGFHAACIGQIDADGALRMKGCHGDETALATLAAIGARAPAVTDPAEASPGVRVLRGDGPLVIPDIHAAGAPVPEWVRSRLLGAGLAAQAILPIGSPPWGVLGLYADKPQTFDAEEVALFQRLVDEIDYALDFIAKGERLEYLAYHNPVSGLYNRSALHDRLRPRLQREPLVLALLDIERFSAINESRGRAFGDALLRQAGQRLRELVGASGIVAHLEADTFALAYRASSAIEGEQERLEHLLREFESEPFLIGDEEIRIDLRAGLAIAPDHGDEAEELEHSAAAALLEGARRKLRLHAFSDELRGRAARRLSLEHELRVAIEQQQFELYYQPKFDAVAQQLSGAEALLRWRHPERGLVSPGEFIPVLEDSELIVPVGRWVMREALRAALAWREHRPGLRIAVNVSAREMRHSRFLDECRALLQPHAGDPPLDIEITESLLMEDINHSRQLLDALRELGSRIAIDDFGTGYSSLNYLARLSIDELKIDISFVSVLAESPETLALVTNIISLAHALNMKVVAEGVEDEEQAKLLRLLRCDILQGYLLGRPEPAAQFQARLQGTAPR